MSFLQIDHVTHTYFSLKEKTTAIQHINMEIDQGEFISFIAFQRLRKNHPFVYHCRNNTAL